MEKQLPLFAYELTASAQQTIREALALLERQLREPGASYTSSSSVRDWLRLQLTMEEREAFVLLLLDNQHRMITHETLFKGTISHTEVHPREVVKATLKYNAAAVIVAHCHPSGHAEPSPVSVRQWRYTASIRSPGCSASVPANINGPAASATMPVARWKISAVYWPYSLSAARTAMARMSYYAA